MNFEFNKTNQLEIHSAFCITDSFKDCPNCGSLEYSSLFLYFFASKVPFSNTISLDSVGPNEIFCMRCTCGHSWLVNSTPVYNRPRIKGIWMRNFQKKEI